MNHMKEVVFEQIEVGEYHNFAYLLGDKESGEAALIDPSFSPLMLVSRPLPPT